MPTVFGTRERVPDRIRGEIRAGYGFLCAPLAAGAVAASFAALSAYVTKGFGTQVNVGEAGLFGLIIGLVVGYAEMLVLGMPTHFLLRRLRITALWVYASLSTAFGLVPLAVPLLSQSSSFDLSIFMFLAGAGAAGCAAGVTFWFVARPDLHVQGLHPQRKV